VPVANVRDVEGLYDQIVADEDFVHEVSKRDLPYDYMKRDSHIWSCWTSRTLPVASAPWRITSSSGPQAKALTKQLKSFPELQRLRLVLLEAIFRGYAGFEFEFNPPGEDCIVRDIIPIRADKITFTNEGEPRLITQDHPYEGEPMPFPKFVVVSHGERYHGHQRGMGLGQKVWWPYFMKSAGMKFWAIAVERFGMPGIKAKIENTGSIADRRARWKEILRDYVGGSGVVYMGEEEIDLIEANNPGMAYTKFCEFLDSEISKAMVGQTLTTEQGSRGAYSLGKVHAAVRDDIMWGDTHWLDEILSRHVLRVFGTLLYGDKYKPAVFESIWENAEETIRNAERLKTLMELRPDLRKEDVYAAMGFPIPKDGEERFKWPAKPKPMAPPNPGGADEGGRPFGTAKPLNKERKPPEDKFSEADREAVARGELDRVDDLGMAASVLAAKEFTLDQLKKRLEKKKG
jgi:phage gp29-like protein